MGISKQGSFRFEGVFPIIGPIYDDNIDGFTLSTAYSTVFEITSGGGTFFNSRIPYSANGGASGGTLNMELRITIDGVVYTFLGTPRTIGVNSNQSRFYDYAEDELVYSSAKIPKIYFRESFKLEAKAIITGTTIINSSSSPTIYYAKNLTPA